jgi:regulator of cell morphogenesis and NO signaling
LVEKVCKELAEHMVEEENVVFPRVKQIKQANASGTSIPAVEETFEAMVNRMESEHDAVGRAMEKIRDLSEDYTIPADACASYTLLFKMLQEFESDLFTHIHLENNILFPKTIEMEKSI